MQNQTPNVFFHYLKLSITLVLPQQRMSICVDCKIIKLEKKTHLNAPFCVFARFELGNNSFPTSYEIYI